MSSNRPKILNKNEKDKYTEIILLPITDLP
jgi:hypothetical protein